MTIFGINKSGGSYCGNFSSYGGNSKKVVDTSVSDSGDDDVIS